MLRIELELDEKYCLQKIPRTNTTEDRRCPVYSGFFCLNFITVDGYREEPKYDPIAREYLRCPQCLAKEKEQL